MRRASATATTAGRRPSSEERAQHRDHRPDSGRRGCDPGRRAGGERDPHRDRDRVLRRHRDARLPPLHGEPLPARLAAHARPGDPLRLDRARPARIRRREPLGRAGLHRPARARLLRRVLGDHAAAPLRVSAMAEPPIPTEGILLTHFIVSADVDRSRRFYTEVLGGETVREGRPAIVALANGWVIINDGGGPTEDKPSVTLEVPPDPNRTSSFLNIRVADIQAVYSEWSARGAEFLTPPQDRGSEIRCYVRDPDGHLIEVGQTTRMPG